MFSIIGLTATNGNESYKIATGVTLDTVTAVVLLVIGSLIIKGTISANPTAAYYLLPIGGFSSCPIIAVGGLIIGNIIKEKMTD